MSLFGRKLAAFELHSRERHASHRSLPSRDWIGLLGEGSVYGIFKFMSQKAPRLSSNAYRLEGRPFVRSSIDYSVAFIVGSTRGACSRRLTRFVQNHLKHSHEFRVNGLRDIESHKAVG